MSKGLEDQDWDWDFWAEKLVLEKQEMEDGVTAEHVRAMETWNEKHASKTGARKGKGKAVGTKKGKDATEDKMDEDAAHGSTEESLEDQMR